MQGLLAGFEDSIAPPRHSATCIDEAKTVEIKEENEPVMPRPPPLLTPQPADFAVIAQLIASAKQKAVQAVNTTLIELYW
ncbi:hypothetical protein [Azonexus sp.]|uniref:hypothetical protein n=1 Tax=Azonexus sp. TaxID=1872668 RepID=UPI0039E6E0CD